MPGGADGTIVCAGEVTEAVVTGAFAATGKGGAVVLAGLSRDPDELISARYRLEDITAGYADLARGQTPAG